MEIMTNVFISAVGSFGEFADALGSLWSEWWRLLVTLLSSGFVAYGVLMAITFARAGDDEALAKRAKRKMLWYTVAIIIIFVIIVGVPMIIAGMTDWAEQHGGLMTVMALGI